MTDVMNEGDASDDVLVLAITRKPESPSFEQRIANYVEPLGDLGVHVAWQMLPKDRAAMRKLLKRAGEYDVVWWHRYLPQPWSPRRMRQHMRKVVFDFDDPLSFSSAGGGRPSLTRRLRFAAMLRACDAALPASHYLADLARPYVEDIAVTPMAIDVPDVLTRRTWNSESIELLWLGSASTQPYLELIRPALEQLGARHKHLRLRLVAHDAMTFGDLPVDFRNWSHDEQAAALAECHVGLCPMPDTLWTRGKCPYKVLQYMAAGMPWVGAAVGENLITAGDAASTRGLVATDVEGWVHAVEAIVRDKAMAQRMGASGYAYVHQHHSRDALTRQLGAFFRRLAGKA
jgi:glycosyltransferase involved in cell wall biosynthesis